jgi:hypothetical protein
MRSSEAYSVGADNLLAKSERPHRTGGNLSALPRHAPESDAGTVVGAALQTSRGGDSDGGCSPKEHHKEAQQHHRAAE